MDDFEKEKETQELEVLVPPAAQGGMVIRSDEEMNAMAEQVGQRYGQPRRKESDGNRNN